MRNTAKFTTAVLAAGALTLGLTACGSGKSSASHDYSGPLVVAATPVPHAEVLDFVEKNLAKKAGLDLQVKEFTDYITPNTATQDGSVGANYFQTKPYLDDFNKKRGTDLVSVAGVHLEPLGLYSHKAKKAADLKNGATVAVPNDADNESRALKLLATGGSSPSSPASPRPPPRTSPTTPSTSSSRRSRRPRPRAPWTTWTRRSSTATTPSPRASSPPRTPSSWSPRRTTRTSTSSS